MPAEKLAGRALKHAEETRRRVDAGKERTEPAGDKVSVSALKRLQTSFFDSGDLQDALESSGLDSLSSRRLLLRRMAKEQEGKLAMMSLASYRDLLEANQLDAPEDELSPMMLRYFISIWLQHHPVEKIGMEAYRELRTYVEAIDGLLSGKNVAVLDMLMQQFKARTMSIAEGNWHAAKWLQLIPEGSGLDAVLPGERDWANRMRDEELKAAERADKAQRGAPRGSRDF